MENTNLYVEESCTQYKMAVDLLGRYKSKLPWCENERILDIGCGPGHITAQLILPLTHPSTQVIGCDISTSMINFAQSHFEDEKLKFTTADISAENIAAKLGKEAFDKVFSFFCLNWVNDQRKAIENIWDLLKPNGYVLFTLIARDQINVLCNDVISKEPRYIDYLKDAHRYIMPYQYIENPSEAQKKLLESTGFKVLECYTTNLILHSHSVESLKRTAEAVNPFVSKMPEKLRAEFMDYIMNILNDKGLIIVDKTDGNETHGITGNDMMVVFCQKVDKLL